MQQPLKSCEGNPSYGFYCSLRSLVWYLIWFGGFWSVLGQVALGGFDRLPSRAFGQNARPKRLSGRNAYFAFRTSQIALSPRL